MLKHHFKATVYSHYTITQFYILSAATISWWIQKLFHCV